jgi:hydrogen peroxide-dependent heme synthase
VSPASISQATSQQRLSAAKSLAQRGTIASIRSIMSAPTAPTAAPLIAKPIVPQEGMHVQHLFYSVNHSQWSLYSPEEQAEAIANLKRVIDAARSHPRTQLLAFSMLTPKSDVGFMLLTPDLQDSNRIEKELTRALGPDVLVPSYSYLSMTELSEYSTPESEFRQELVTKENLTEGTEAFEARLAEWRARMAKYNQDRLYPNMPDWQVFCFYNMSKRRGEPGQNWYATGFEDRRKLMAGHARVGRTWAGKVRQLITGSTGLDAAEWGVTLFAHDTFHIKGIVYEMRFDEVSAQYGEFGDFYIGIQLPVEDLVARVGLA